MGGLDGDRIVQVLGLVMVLALLSRGSVIRRMPIRERVLYGAVWVGIFGVVAAIAAVLTR